MNTTSIRRLRPAKPVHTPPVEFTKTSSSETALQLLNTFVTEARKEIRKRENLILKGKFNQTDCDSVTFLGDTFSLTIDFKGGIRL